MRNERINEATHSVAKMLSPRNRKTNMTAKAKRWLGNGEKAGYHARQLRSGASFGPLQNVEPPFPRPSAKGRAGRRIVSAPEKPMARQPIFGYCSCPSPMIHPFPHAIASAALRRGARAVVRRLRASADSRLYRGEGSASSHAGTRRPRQPRDRTKRASSSRLHTARRMAGSGSELDEPASISASRRADGEATVNITPLAGMAGTRGGDREYVARAGRPAGPRRAGPGRRSDTRSKSRVSRASFSRSPGTRDGKPLRIVTAFVHRPDGSWFYKLQGGEAVVAAQKPAFVEFLKTVRIKEGGGPAPTAAAAASPPRPRLRWLCPRVGRRCPAGQMQVAKFAVPEHDGAKAEVSVSVFPSDTGGTLANVNRWRRQLGMSETDEAGLAGMRHSARRRGHRWRARRDARRSHQ